MSVISVVLLVVIIIVALLLVQLILLQGGEADGMGGMLGGQGTQAFGSKSGNVLTKTTGVMVTIFLVATFALGLLNKSPKVADLQDASEAAAEVEKTENAEWWKEDEAKTAEDSAANVSGGAQVVANDGAVSSEIEAQKPVKQAADAPQEVKAAVETPAPAVKEEAPAAPQETVSEKTDDAAAENAENAENAEDKGKTKKAKKSKKK